MDARHRWGKHYEVHSLYGHSEAIATRRSVQYLFTVKETKYLLKCTSVETDKFKYTRRTTNMFSCAMPTYRICCPLTDFGISGTFQLPTRKCWASLVALIYLCLSICIRVSSYLSFETIASIERSYFLSFAEHYCT